MQNKLILNFKKIPIFKNALLKLKNRKFLASLAMAVLLIQSLFLLQPITTFAQDAVYSSASSFGSGQLPLTDDFNDNSINSYLWPTVESSTTTISEKNNRIEITPVANTFGYADIKTRTLNFTNAQFQFDFAQTLGGNYVFGYNDQGFLLTLDSNNAIAIGKGGGSGANGAFTVKTNGVNNTTAFTDSYTSQTYRIRMSGTTANFERWNGASWTTVSSKTVSWSLSAVTISLYAGYWGTGNSSTQPGIFDNIASSGITYDSNTATDSDGNIYDTGSFTGTMDFDPGVGTYNLTSTGADDIYVRKLNSSNELMWVKQFGSTGSDKGYSISVDGAGIVTVIGSFSGTVDFDPGPGTQNLVSNSTDIFTLNLSQTLLPTVTTTNSGSITSSSALLSGNISDTGKDNPTTRGFEYGLTNAYGSLATESGTFGVGDFTAQINSLDCATLYHFRAYATNSQGTSYGSDDTFTTSDCPLFAPTVTTGIVSNILKTTATIAGEVTDTGGVDISDRGFEYGLTTSYSDQIGELGTFSAGAFASDLSSLSCGTTYHYRAYAVNSEGTSHGVDNTFTTENCTSSRVVGSYSYQSQFANFVGLKFPTNLSTPSISSLSKIISVNQTLFLRDLDLGSSGEDVKLLQQFLNKNGFIVATTGVGSLGHETTFFGSLTKSAVKKLQETFYQSILAPVNLTAGTGFFGPSTRNFLNNLGK